MRFPPVGAVYEKELGTESNFLRNVIDMQQLIKEIALCPQFLHTFIDRPYNVARHAIRGRLADRCFDDAH